MHAFRFPRPFVKRNSSNMKVSILCLLVAVYGVASQTTTTSSDSTPAAAPSTTSTADSSSTTDSAATPAAPSPTKSTSGWIGGALGKVNSLAQKGISFKGSVVNNTIGLTNSTIQSVTGIATNAISKGASWGNEGIKVGADLVKDAIGKGRDLSNQTLSFVNKLPIINKFIPTSSIQSIIDKLAQFGSSGVNKVESVANSVVNSKSKFGQKVTGGIGSVSTKVTNALVAGENKVVSVANKLVNSTFHGIAGSIKSVGNVVSNIGSRISTSATLTS